VASRCVCKKYTRVDPFDQVFEESIASPDLVGNPPSAKDIIGCLFKDVTIVRWLSGGTKHVGPLKELLGRNQGGTGGVLSSNEARWGGVLSGLICLPGFQFMGRREAISVPS